ncbi:MAG: hypothetical protein EZS28_024237 [Streblomastix strix]|uniref:Ubiquitin-like domain-containing protein n=1 Tax=Streblomastix strix TaxID=222440 RepID=A0A5J4VCQ9_9EUKA|nr:MAG: hypothetical protein EZS28_024237 [Streblomastix strix]
MHLIIRDLNKDVFTVNVEGPEETIETVKLRIIACQDINYHELYLIYKNEVLEDERTLKSYNITQRCTLNLIVKEQEKPHHQPDNNHVEIIVRSLYGEEIHVKMHKKTKIEKLINAVSEHFGIRQTQFHLLFEGYHVHQEDTCEKLEIQNGDVIEFMRTLVAG